MRSGLGFDTNRTSPKLTALMNISSHEQTFNRVATISIALSFGIVAALVGSIEEIAPVLKLQMSMGVPIGFALGSTAGWKLWQTVWNARKGLAGSQRKIIWWGLILSLFTLGSFAYGLRGSSREKIIEFAIGTATAAVFLTVGGFLLYSVIKYFHNEEPK